MYTRRQFLTQEIGMSCLHAVGKTVPPWRMTISICKSYRKPDEAGSGLGFEDIWASEEYWWPASLEAKQEVKVHGFMEGLGSEKVNKQAIDLGEQCQLATCPTLPSINTWCAMHKPCLYSNTPCNVWTATYHAIFVQQCLYVCTAIHHEMHKPFTVGMKINITFQG